MTEPDDKDVISILYPTVWFAQPGGLDRALSELQAIDPRIEVVLAPFEEPHERRAARGADPTKDWHADAPEVSDEVRDALSRSHAILALDAPVDIVDRAPNLRWIQAFGAGADQFDSCNVHDAGITVTSSAGSNAIGIAEFAIGRVLEYNKRFIETREMQGTQTWEPRFGREISGQTLGLVGLGAINSAVAERARAFGMTVLATRGSANPGDTHPLVDELHPAAELMSVLARCDAVISAVPDNPSSRGLFDTAAFAAMQPGAIFVNVGRGSLVDEAALVEALESGHLGGAALDVASSEPLPADHPMWTAPRLSLSFHQAAVPEAMFANVHALFNANVARFIADEPLASVVKPPSV